MVHLYVFVNVCVVNICLHICDCTCVWVCLCVSDTFCVYVQVLAREQFIVVGYVGLVKLLGEMWAKKVLHTL